MTELTNCPALHQTVEEFDGWSDFRWFQKRLDEHSDFVLIQTIGEDEYGAFREKMYKCSKCNQVWKLVNPDPPFAGLWERVE